MGAAVTAQQTYRFREDDGSITGATWLGSGNDDDISRGTGTSNKFRFRAVVEETNGGNANVPWLLYASYNSGTYFQVTTTSSYVQLVASDYVSDGTAITVNELGYTGTYNADTFDSDAAKTNNALSSEYGEPEYCLYVVDADVADTDTIDLRVYESSGVPCDSYTVTARVTVTKAAGDLSIPDASDTVTVTSTVTLEGIPNPEASDTVTITSQVTIDPILLATSIADVVTIADATPVVSVVSGVPEDREVTEADTVTISGASLVEVLTSLATLDNVLVADAATVVMADVAASAVDTMTISDLIVALTIALSAQQSDTVTISDDPTVQIESEAGPTLSIAITAEAGYYVERPIIVG